MSHDFLDDPDTYELRRLFGDRAVFMWLRMLSWADRNEGELKGDRAFIATTFGRDHDPIHPTSNRDRGLKVLRWMEDRGWIESRSGFIYIANYLEYHKTRGAHKIPPGISNSPPPSEPSEPSEPTQDKRRSSEDSKQLARVENLDPSSLSEGSEETEGLSAHAEEDKNSPSPHPLSKQSGYSETALLVYEVRKAVVGESMDRVLPNNMLARIEQAVAGHLRDEVEEVYREWIVQGYEPRYFGWLRWLEQGHVPGRKQAAQWRKSKTEREAAKRGCRLCDETGFCETTDANGVVKTYRCTHGAEANQHTTNGGPPA